MWWMSRPDCPQLAISEAAGCGFVEVVGGMWLWHPIFGVSWRPNRWCRCVCLGVVGAGGLREVVDRRDNMTVAVPLSCSRYTLKTQFAYLNLWPITMGMGFWWVQILVPRPVPVTKTCQKPAGCPYPCRTLDRGIPLQLIFLGYVQRTTGLMPLWPLLIGADIHNCTHMSGHMYLQNNFLPSSSIFVTVKTGSCWILSALMTNYLWASSGRCWVPS